MAKHDEVMNQKKRRARSKAEFFRYAGIGSELANFLTELIEEPEIIYSIPNERRRQLELQMDTILSSFEQ